MDAKRARFEKLNAQVLDISVDSIPSHIAWRKKELGEVSIPLCADFFPHGQVTAAFGILRDGPPVPGISERAAFVVNREGIVTFARIYPLDQLPDIEELIAEVGKLAA